MRRRQPPKNIVAWNWILQPNPNLCSIFIYSILLSISKSCAILYRCPWLNASPPNETSVSFELSQSVFNKISFNKKKWTEQDKNRSENNFRWVGFSFQVAQFILKWWKSWAFYEIRLRTHPLAKIWSLLSASLFWIWHKSFVYFPETKQINNKCCEAQKLTEDLND